MSGHSRRKPIFLHNHTDLGTFFNDIRLKPTFHLVTGGSLSNLTESCILKRYDSSVERAVDTYNLAAR